MRALSSDGKALLAVGAPLSAAPHEQQPQVAASYQAAVSGQSIDDRVVSDGVR